MSGTILGSGSTYLENRVLKHSLGITPWTMPPLVFVGLCTSQPSATTPGAEVTGGAYVRLSATFSVADSPGNVALNAATLEWPAATASWGTLGWFELWDALTLGNRQYQGTLIDPASGAPVTRIIGPGDILRIAAGSLAVRAF